MKISKMQGSVGWGQYYCIETVIKGIDCIFRMSESNYCQLVEKITGDYNGNQDDPRIKEAIQERLYHLIEFRE